jgi:predicted MFS family arabinose efflux permease
MMTERAGYGEFRRGWPIVLSAFLGIGLGLSPLPFYTAGVFAPHLAAAFGWKIGDIFTSLLITTLMVVWAGPLAGVLAVRWGVRRVALVSTALFGLAFMLPALSNGSLALFYASWAVIAIAGAGTLPITWTRAVNHRFDVRKGFALGLSLMGTGLFGILCKPYLAWAIGAFGWRGGYVALGLLPLLIALPVGFFLFRDEDAPHGDAPPPLVSGFTLAETLRDWRFWLIALAILPISFSLAGPVPNLENILKHSGMTPERMLALTPLVGVTALLGRLIGGWLLDRFWAPAVGFVILGAPAVSCWILAGDALGFDMAAAAILLIGFALGVEYDLIAFLVARYFGLKSYAAIYGILYVCFALGSGLAPLVFGRDFDAHGNYHLALIASSAALVASAASLMLLGRYRVFADTSAAAA